MHSKTLLILFILSLPGLAKPAISYSVGWPDGHRNWFQIHITVEKPSGKSSDFRIPAWRPGRYIMQSFGRNVSGFSATDGAGRKLDHHKTDKDTWRVNHQGAGKLVISYSYYASTLDAGNSYVDDRQAFLNPVTMLMYLPGREREAVELSLQTPPDWQIASALDRNSNGKLQAADYHELADSPVLASPDFVLHSFEHQAVQYDLVFQGAPDVPAAAIAADLHKIIAAQVAMLGPAPMKRFVFLFQLTDRRVRHGVEHRNSTAIVLGPADFETDRFQRSMRSVCAHEFMHVWIVERIRPASIYYPDYSREGYTAHMWFYEGVTDYLAWMSLQRSGLISSEAFYNNLSTSLTRFLNSPASEITSPALSSWDSWNHASDSPPATQVSVYESGKLLGLVMDLRIRQESGGAKGLEDLVRNLYSEYARRDRGLPEEGLRKSLEKLTGSSWKTFFDRHIFSASRPDFAAYLLPAGLLLQESFAAEQSPVYTGLELSEVSGRLQVRQVQPGSPADTARFITGDELLAIDGKQLTAKNLEALQLPYQPGNRVRIDYFRRGELRQQHLTLAENRQRQYRIAPQDSSGEAVQRLQTSWLNGPRP